MPSVAKGLAIVVTIAAIMLFALGAWIELKRVGSLFDSPQADDLVKQPAMPDRGDVLLTAAGMFAVGRYILPLAVGLSGAIAGERYRRTLDSLLSTPIDRRTILRAKVQAHAERGTAFAAIAVAAVGMAFTADGDIRLGVSSAALVLGIIGLILGLGAWLTVRCPNDVRAFWLLLPFTLVAVVWPVGLWQLLHSDPAVPRELLTQAVLVAASASGLAGLVFWWLAERRIVGGE
jgi:ABC-type Na+ efflux pump permease subunit